MTKQEIQNIKNRYGIIGQNEILNQAVERALTVARTDLSVLVMGENGSGKEVFARIIHENSSRKHNAFLSINCGAIPEGTIDSELFGHEKGAYTGALTDRKGYFEEANGGTLFLDEVGELPLATQARLLRVLETGEYIRMGSSEIRKTNVRVVAATNLNMQRAIEDGRFRMDLYYRLNGVSVHVPALRERKEDIPLLFRKFAADFADKYRMPAAIRLTPDANHVLQEFRWTGNVRQLKHIAEQVSLLEANHEVTADVLARYLSEENEPLSEGVRVHHTTHSRSYEQEREMLVKMIMDLRKDVSELQQKISGATEEWPQPAAGAVKMLESSPHPSDEAEMVEVVEPTTMEDLERETIRKALERNKGNRKAAAAEIGISERTLYRKINGYGL